MRLLKRPTTMVPVAAALLTAAMLAGSSALADEPSLLGKARDHLTDVWQTGTGDLYLPFHTHHVRSTYDQASIDNYQETPLGAGYGRSKFDRNGDWHGVYAMGFQDSHFKPSYMAGYSFLTFWRPAADWRAGVGFTAFLMARSDIAHYTPFPLALPIGSISYKNIAIEASYVPGFRDAGNVMFFWGRLPLQ